MMRIEMLLAFDFDPETGEQIPVSSKLISEKPVKESKAKSTSTSKKSEDAPKTGVLLESNKLILSEQAVQLLGVEPDDRIAITYEKKGRFFLPVIGVDEKKGNKLTKSNTISYRGKANDELSKYGSVFELEEHKNNKFFLKGQNEVEAPVEKVLPEIQVDEDEVSMDSGFSVNLDEVEATEIKTTFNFDDIELS